MKKLVIVLVSAALLLILSLLLWSRLRSSSHTTITSAPQFQITADEVASVSVQPVTSVKSGRKTAELDVVFSSGETAKFHKFAQEHLNQKVQFVVGTNVIVETRLDSAISSGRLELSYASIEEAQAVADSLTKK